MKVTVFGTGYVGLVSGVCLAEIGHDVMCVDVDTAKIQALRQAKSPIYEPGLEELLAKNLQSGRLQFTTDAALGVAFGLIQFIAVGTPPRPNGSADLQYVMTVAETIGKHMSDYRVIVNKSTVPVGTANQVAAHINSVLKKNFKICDFDVISNPEFLREGSAIFDCLNPDRIIIGTESPRATEVMHALYQPFLHGKKTKWLVMDPASSELSKYAANAFLATKISFMNELAGLVEKIGGDITLIREGIGSDNRIGSAFLNAGCGYGGSCFPKDVSALRFIADAEHCPLTLLDAVQNVNQYYKRVLFDKLNQYFKRQLSGKHIAFLGLAFKPNTDDMRDATSHVLLNLLWQAGVIVKAYDPIAMPAAQQFYPNRRDFVLCHSVVEALKDADAALIVTEWDQFKAISAQQFKSLLANPIVFDGRNLYSAQQMQAAGIEYFGVGYGQTLTTSKIKEAVLSSVES